MGEAEPMNIDGGLGFDAPVAGSGHSCPAPPVRATLPPPAAPGLHVVAHAALTPGQVLAAPNGGRLRHLPPPAIVADAVPLDLDALEDAAKRARTRPPSVGDDDDPTAARLLATPLRTTNSPVAPPSKDSLRLRPPANGTNGHDREASRRDAVAQAMRAWSIDRPVEPEAAGAPVQAPATVAAEATRQRRRPGMLVGSVVAFASIALGTAVWAQNRRGDDTAPAAIAGAATTAATVVTTAQPTTPTTPATAAPTSVATVATVAPTTMPTPATTVPVTTPSTAPAPTTAATVAPEVPPSAASVLGTTVLNRDLLDALGKGTLPGGQTWPRATFVDGKLVVTGAAPTAADADAIIRSARTLAVSPDAVVNQLVVDASVPQVRYLAVQLFTNPIFDRGSTTIRKDSEGVFELWGKRLRDDPGRSLVVIAHGDGTSTALASTRAKTSLARLLAAGGVAPEQIEAQWASGAPTGPRVTFAITIA